MMITKKRFWSTALIAWLVFIGVDFIFHASLLEKFWSEEVAAFKPDRELFLLIPAGYLSFLLLTLLAGFTFWKAYPEKPKRYTAIRFGMFFSLAFAASYFLASFSFLSIPVLHLFFFSLVYLIELLVVFNIFYQGLYTEHFKVVSRNATIAFFLLVITGIVIQNL